MKGHILDFTVQTNSGIISGDDNQRYTFHGTDWMEQDPPRRGMAVDFATVGDQATQIYAALGARPASAYGSRAGAGASPNYSVDDKRKVEAGLLGIFLGWQGIHKFYLGYTVPGIIMLALGIVGVVCIATSISIIGIFIIMAVGVIGLIEGIIYLTKSDDDFHNEYVVQQKPWF